MGTGLTEIQKIFPDYIPTDDDTIAHVAEKRSREQIKAENMARLIESAVPPKYRDLKLADIDRERRNLVGRVVAGCSGLIIGGNGTGKTAFLMVLFKELLGRDVTVRYAHAKTISDLINCEVLDSRKTLEEVVRQHWGRNIEVLLIDELDKMTDSQASRINLYELVDWRYSHMLQTVAVANATPDSILQKIPQDVYSRLTCDAEGGFKAIFGGKDRRRKGND